MVLERLLLHPRRHHAKLVEQHVHLANDDASRLVVGAEHGGEPPRHSERPARTAGQDRHLVRRIARSGELPIDHAEPPVKADEDVLPQ